MRTLSDGTRIGRRDRSKPQESKELQIERFEKNLKESIQDFKTTKRCK